MCANASLSDAKPETTARRASVEESPADFTGPVNLGNPEEFTIREFAEKVVGMTNATGGIRARARGPKTTHASAGRTLASPVPASAGSRRSALLKGSARRSPTSAAARLSPDLAVGFICRRRRKQTW